MAPTTAAAPNTVDTWHQWAYGVLNGIGAPITQTNLQTLWNWSIKESGQNVMRWNNPLNTTQNAPGATSQNSVGVKSYPVVSTGTAATVQTLTNGRYPAIVGALKSSTPSGQWAKDPAITKQLGVWGSGANWLSWGNKPPTWVASSFQGGSSGGSNVIGDVGKQLIAAPGALGTSFTDTLTGWQKTALNISTMAVGGILMLAGLLLIGFAALKVAPAPVRDAASTLSNLTPQGRAVRVARAVTPPKQPAAPAPAAAPAASRPPTMAYTAKSGKRYEVNREAGPDYGKRRELT